MNILEEIISYKKLEVDQKKSTVSFDVLQKKSRDTEFPRLSFMPAIKERIKNKETALIAEIKKASPSKGVIKKDFNHLKIAKSYQSGGATCLSVLTDEKYFMGNLKYIKEIKNANISLPILRKDFIIDPYQIYESIHSGADCILLIVAALEKDLLKRLYEIGSENNLDILIEVHDESEIETALNLLGSYRNTTLLGINNRNLKTFKVAIETTKELVTKYKKELENKIVVSESGIFTHEDITDLGKHNVYSFLVGESLIRNDDIENAVKQLLGQL